MTNNRRLFALCRHIGMSREERHELAEMLLKRDVPSYATLTDAEAARLVDALEGFCFMLALMELRVP